MSYDQAVIADLSAEADRWSRRPETTGRQKQYRWRGMDFGYGNTPEQRSAAKITRMKKLIERDRYNHILKKQLRKMEKRHALRTLLGWDWLMEHSEHELSPLHRTAPPPF